MSKYITIYNFDEETTYELASFGQRLAARLIDAFIIAIPLYFIPILPGWLYWSIQQSSASQSTIGQKCLSIKVIDLHDDPVTFAQASGRFFGNILNLLTFFVGYFMFFFTENRQCLHDLLSNTLVVNEMPVNDYTS